MRWPDAQPPKAPLYTPPPPPPPQSTGSDDRMQVEGHKRSREGAKKDEIVYKQATPHMPQPPKTIETQPSKHHQKEEQNHNNQHHHHYQHFKKAMKNKKRKMRISFRNHQAHHTQMMWNKNDLRRKGLKNSIERKQKNYLRWKRLKQKKKKESDEKKS